MAYITYGNVTPSSFTLYVAGLDTNYSKPGRTIYWAVNNVARGSESLGAYASISNGFTVSGLQSYTQHSVYAEIVYDGGVARPDTIYITTRPSYFSWTNGALNWNTGLIEKVSNGSFNLTAQEWNNLCSNINDVRAYMGYWIYNFTSAYPGLTFTYSMYNEAVYAIQGISGYGYYLSTVQSGYPIYAYQMNVLMTELNSIHK